MKDSSLDTVIRHDQEASNQKAKSREVDIQTEELDQALKATAILRPLGDSNTAGNKLQMSGHKKTQSLSHYSLYSGFKSPGATTGSKKFTSPLHSRKASQVELPRKTKIQTYAQLELDRRSIINQQRTLTNLRSPYSKQNLKSQSFAVATQAAPKEPEKKMTDLSMGQADKNQDLVSALDSAPQLNLAPAVATNVNHEPSS